MAIILSPKILDKLSSKHGVCEEEVAQCFANRTGKFLLDTREEHETDPPTLWFISETDFARKLKIVFICRDGNNYIRTAYPPDEKEICIYNKHS